MVDPASLKATPRQVGFELGLFLALLALNWVCFGLNWVCFGFVFW